MQRRHFLAAGTALATGRAIAPFEAFAQAAPEPRNLPTRLTAAPTSVALVGDAAPRTAVWAYDGQVPGPLLRATQGETLVVEFENGLPEPSTIHWHGLRVPLAEDGVPVFSHHPVAPGATHRYTLPLADAGTFWYHPHVNSSEQVGRGLSGLLIVDEPPEVAARLDADREIVWAIDDWRLEADAQIAPFGNRHDASHGGRFGNVLTVNGTQSLAEPVRAGERVRLRLANMANAQYFFLRFGALDPWLIALDGHPVAPVRLGDGGVWIGPGQRADLIVDVDLDPGAQVDVLDTAYGPDEARVVKTFGVAAGSPLRTTPRAAPPMLPANPLAVPDLAAAERHSIVFEGGAMGGMAGARMGGEMRDMRTLAEAGRFWAINGTVPEDIYATPPLLELALGRTHVITLENRTRWPHPIHLHGHSFHVRDPRLPEGSPPVIRDTVLMAPQETTEIWFVADNPGQWMLHCHVLEHQGSGMMGTILVG